MLAASRCCENVPDHIFGDLFVILDLRRIALQQRLGNHSDRCRTTSLNNLHQHDWLIDM
jgi:hypothetical protein